MPKATIDILKIYGAIMHLAVEPVNIMRIELVESLDKMVKARAVTEKIRDISGTRESDPLQ